MEQIINNAFQRNKWMIKGLVIGFMVILLMIPAHLVQNVIQEREQRQREVVTEVTSKWAGAQSIIGPVMVIPYNESVIMSNGQPGTVKKFAYLLPDKLDIQAKANPVERSRGIFQVMLYTSSMKISGNFPAIPLEKLRLNEGNVLWNEIYVCVGLSDKRGLKEQVNIRWNDSLYNLEPAVLDNGAMNEGLSSLVAVGPAQPITFDLQVDINGAEQLQFTPVGKETSASLSSTWPDPSFTGTQLPEHTISKDGFTARWKSFSHTRNFPQHWKDSKYSLQSSSFGTNLFIPINGYQKTMRSVKYAILCIVLTFAAFFIIERVNKHSIHPLQYGLIGVALLLFYTLLLSFSEYMGFNLAYAIAAVATIGLIGWFVRGLLQSGKLSAILSMILVLLYTYLFVILQLQDYSLLLGSVGLFLTLGVIMKFSKGIKW